MRKILVIFIILIVFSITVLFVLSNFTPVSENDIPTVGVIRTIKLSPDELSNLGYVNTNYILDSQGGFYLFFDKSGRIPTGLDGKCVSVVGTVGSVSSKKPDMFYNTGLVNATKISEIPYSRCYVTDNTPVIETRDLPKLTLTGTLRRTPRYVPDISYDYEIKLDKPQIFTNTAIADEISLDSYPLMYSRPQMYETFENLVGKHVEVYGEDTWGYSESRYLNVFEIKEVK